MKTTMENMWYFNLKLFNPSALPPCFRRGADRRLLFNRHATVRKVHFHGRWTKA
jgi:hypothetical protein